MTDFDALIDDLADQATPVRPRKTERGWATGAAIAVATLALVALTFGLRGDVMRMAPSPMVAVAAGLMAMLAVAAGGSAIRMARPQVGARSSGAPWLLAALALLPIAALAAIAENSAEMAGLAMEPGLRCLRFGFVAGLGSLVFLGFWLRSGAPVAPKRASWLAGIAAGAVGALAVTLECGHDEIAHLAVWHVLVVPMMGLVGWAVLPRFLRW